uniref:Serpentine receptor class gamma n=1 Tax=Ditylenchus dipsaci TaxID=166011 RepID=A0A915EBL0_9BILA
MESGSTTTTHLARISSVSTVPTYLPYLLLLQTISIVIFQLITISCMSVLLFSNFFLKRRLKVALSTSIIIYLLVHVIFSLTALPYGFYNIFVWTSTSLNPYILFYTGSSTYAYYYLTPVPVLFLTLDRCLAWKLPVQYMSYIKNIKNI